MVSKPRALFAVAVAAITSTAISRHQAKTTLEQVKFHHRKEVDNTFHDAFKNGWDSALRDPSAVSEAYKKLYLKH